MYRLPLMVVQRYFPSFSKDEALLQANVLVKAIHYGEVWPHENSIETALFNEKLTLFVSL